MNLNPKIILKYFKKNDFKYLIENNLLSYKDFANLYINNFKNFDFQLLKNEVYFETFFNSFLNIKKTKFLNYINNNLKNHYLSYFSLYYYLFIFLYFSKQEAKEKIYIKFLSQLDLKIFDNIKIPNQYLKLIKSLYNLRMKKEASLYEVYLKILKNNNIRINENHLNKIFNKDIIEIEDIETVEEILYLLKEIDHKNIDVFEIYLRLHSNKIINKHMKYEYMKNLIYIYFEYIKYNKRNKLEEIVNSKKYFSYLKNIILKILFNIEFSEEEKKEFNDRFLFYNRKIYKEKINYINNKLKTLINKSNSVNDIIEKSKIDKEIKKLYEEKKQQENEKIFNLNFYFLFNIFIKNYDYLINNVYSLKNKNLIKLFYFLYKERINKEFLEKQILLKNYFFIYLILSDLLNSYKIKYEEYINKEIKDEITKKAKKKLFYISFISKFDKEIKNIIYSKLMNKLIPINEFLDEIITNSSCKICIAELKNLNIDIFFNFFPQIKEKIPTKNLTFIEKYLLRKEKKT